MTGSEQGTVADPPHISWEIKAIILAGGPAVAMAVTGVSIALPGIEAELAQSSADRFLIKMLIGVVGAAMVVGAPLTGFLMDRVGLRRVVFLIYFVYVVAGTAGLYLEDLHTLVVARFMLGMAGTGAATTSIVIINQRFPSSERAKWMGAYIAVSFISALALHPLAGQLAEIDWHLTFAIYLFGAPFALLALMAFRIPAPIPADGAEQDPNRESLLTWFPFRFAVLGLVMGCVSYLPLIYAPFLLRDMGIGPAKASIVLLGDTLTGTVMALLFGWSRKFLSENATFAFAFVCTAIGGIITACASDYVMVLLGMGVIGLGTAWFIPNLMTVLGESVHARRQGRAAGLVKAANYLSTPVCIVAVERLAQAFGPRIPILISSILALILLVWSLNQIARRSRRRSQASG